MTVEISQAYKDLSNRIFTLSFVCIAVKYLPVEAVSGAGLKINIADKSVISGSLSVVITGLLFAATLSLYRDYLNTIAKDRIISIERPDITTINFDIKSSPIPPSWLESNATLYWCVLWIIFCLEGLLPIMLGAIVAFISRQDMVAFIETITK